MAATPLPANLERTLIAATGDRAVGSWMANLLSNLVDSLGNGDAAGAGVTAGEKYNAPHTTTLTLVNASVPTVDGGAGGASGGLKIYDFPAGNITITGATCNLTTLAGAGGITDTAAVVGSLGSVVAAADATLTSTEANVIPSTAGTLVGGAGVINGESTAAVTLNGTSTAVDLYLNFAMPDAGSTADDTITVNGTISFTWINSGDN